MLKSAVLLLNLGSPKSCEVGDVRDYLREFLGDERVIDGSPLKRWLLLHGIILRRRPPKSAAAYKKVWTPEGAPLLAITERLRAKLETTAGVRVYAAMRYGEPSCRRVIAQIKRDGVERVFVMPQYPHYAMSSYETAVVCAKEEFFKQAPAVETTWLPPMYKDSGYIDALVESAKSYLEKPFDKLLFSYHGLPVRHLKKSDPTHAHCMMFGSCCEGESPAHATCYRHQCFETMKRFIAAAGLPPEKCAISFQSRLGRDEWLRPYTDETLRALAGEGVKKLLVICPAFTADCLETLEEISVEGRHTFLSAGGESFEQIPCLNDQPAYVRFLAEKIAAWRAPEPRFILASASPRRRELLAKHGLFPEVIPAGVIEHEDPNSCPREMVRHNATLKAREVSERFPDALVLGADTTVAIDDVVLNKPADLTEARAMLKKLSGREHTVFTGVCLVRKDAGIEEYFCETSRVVFKQLSDGDITRYFEIVNPLDKAGAYGIQEGREIIIDRFDEPISNIMGLPAERVAARVRELFRDFALS